MYGEQNNVADITTAQSPKGSITILKMNQQYRNQKQFYEARNINVGLKLLFPKLVVELQ